MFVAGIDEAGRGPVIGPLVVCAVVYDNSKLDYIKKMGAKDSKQMTISSRESLFDIIKSSASDFELKIIPASELNDKMSKYSLNDIELFAFADVLNKLKVKPEKVYVDCPDVNPSRFTVRLSDLLDFDAQVIAEHKADSKYPVVSAASILAKVTRDAEIHKISEEYGMDIGSGYPHDEKTIDFLKHLIKNKDLKYVRTKWATYRRLTANQTTFDNYF